MGRVVPRGTLASVSAEAGLDPLFPHCGSLGTLFDHSEPQFIVCEVGVRISPLKAPVGVYWVMGHVKPSGPFAVIDSVHPSGVPVSPAGQMRALGVPGLRDLLAEGAPL